jgi:pyruvate/2-oxoglutarate dehydrogenase complex dihydrolipoamide dehydrogenase (E3) component
VASYWLGIWRDRGVGLPSSSAGGSGLNIACLPSKNEIWSARVAHLARHAAQFGTVTGPVTIDMAKVRQRKRDMVDREIALHLHNYQTSGGELIMGAGRFGRRKRSRYT